MRIIIMWFFLLAQVFGAHARDNLWDWESGPYTPGFQLLERQDYSRYYPSGKSDGPGARPVRVYIWYPAENKNQKPMRIKEYVQMAAADFETDSLPVPLSKGLNDDELATLLDRHTDAVRDAAFAKGRLPLLVFGQGLYYESPLSHVVLCEFLASHGFIVATCPLLGTHYRLVNLDVEDLETEIRDLEFVIEAVRTIPEIEIENLGVIGYDLGGMAGLILSMRNAGIKAFLSLDAGILFGHFSGLPNSHPSYNEKDFSIPWMHITQSRFVETFRDEQGLSNLFERKTYGDSYLVKVPTDNHGEFSSYAVFGIENALAGYWGPWRESPQVRYKAICHKVLDFFGAYLRKNRISMDRLKGSAQIQDPEEEEISVEYKPGLPAPPSADDLMHLIIEKGMANARNVIEKARTGFPDGLLFDESVLNWLGYHFLYWWGREEEALEIFKLNASLFPESANAFDSLGEAYIMRGDTESAIRCYEKSLELNPDNANAAQILKRLKKEK